MGLLIVDGQIDIGWHFDEEHHQQDNFTYFRVVPVLHILQHLKVILLSIFYNYHTFNSGTISSSRLSRCLLDGAKVKFGLIGILYLFDNCVTLMGDLLLNWLNDEIQLSKRITNFEEDFHNGYLFGELLAKYSQQLNFHEFIDKYKHCYPGMIRPLESKTTLCCSKPSQPWESPSIRMLLWRSSISSWESQRSFSMSWKQ